MIFIYLWTHQYIYHLKFSGLKRKGVGTKSQWDFTIVTQSVHSRQKKYLSIFLTATLFCRLFCPFSLQIHQIAQIPQHLFVICYLFTFLFFMELLSGLYLLFIETDDFVFLGQLALEGRRVHSNVGSLEIIGKEAALLLFVNGWSKHWVYKLKYF